MRLGLVLDGTLVDRGAVALRAAAARAEDLGLDLVWVRQDARMPDPFLAAVTVAAATTGLRIGVEAELGDAHPVVTAEQAAVCDLATGGRLLLGLRAAPGAEEDLGEAVELVIRSHRPRPFRAQGGRWPTPAALEANSFMRDTTVRVTPAPAQPELPTWVVGSPAVAARFGLPPLLSGLHDGPGTWDVLDDRLGEAALRLSRPALVDLPVDGGRVDHAAAIDSLVGARDRWGLDTALLRLPAGLDADDRDAVLRDVARVVRPRVQQERIPEGLRSWWDEELLG